MCVWVCVTVISMRSFKRNLHPGATQKSYLPAEIFTLVPPSNMTEQIAKLLKDYLEELNDTMLAEFKWYMSQHTETGARPVQRSQLETSSRMETVDKLVQAFGGDGAVVIAVDILYRMRLNDLATRLSQGKTFCDHLSRSTSNQMMAH